MARRLWASAALVLASVAGLMPLSGGCASNGAADDGRLCTPGNYVFCRCADRSEGTKLCKPDGKTFESCQPCTTGEETGTDAGELPTDAGFQPVDSGPPPDAGIAPIEAACVGKLAVLAGAGGEQDLDALAGVYKGNGVFEVSVSHGPALRSNAKIVLTGTSLIGVYLSRYSFIVGAKFTTSWSAPVSIGSAMTDAPPSVTSLGTQAKMVYRGLDGLFYAGTYNAGWDDATSPAEPAGDAGSVRRSAPSLAAVGSSLVFGFVTDDQGLNRVSSSGSTWGAPLKVPAATAYFDAPALVAMNGGSADLIMLYTGTDFALHSVTRAASNKAWSSPVVVDDSAQPIEPPAVVEMANGRAMVVWKASNDQAFYSIYDPGAAMPWSAPAGIVPNKNPTVTSTPAIAESKCGAEIVLAYSEQGGGVSLMRYASGAWKGPYPVGGMSNVTYVGVGELP